MREMIGIGASWRINKLDKYTFFDTSTEAVDANKELNGVIEVYLQGVGWIRSETLNTKPQKGKSNEF